MLEKDTSRRPCLGTIVYAVHPWFPDKGWRGRLCWKDSGPGWRSLRKPYRKINRIRSRAEGVLIPMKCRMGWHQPMDYINMDASIDYAECLHCHAQVAPHRPRAADPEEQARMEESNALAEEFGDAMDAFLGGVGPCPDCQGVGDHVVGCVLGGDW